MPAVITHRKAVSTELMMMVTRAARTPQGSHDLEAALREYRTIANAKARLSFYWQQRHELSRQAGSDGVVKQYTVGISQVSDTYLTELLQSFYDTREVYLTVFGAKCTRPPLGTHVLSAHDHLNPTAALTLTSPSPSPPPTITPATLTSVALTSTAITSASTSTAVASATLTTTLTP